VSEKRDQHWQTAGPKSRRRLRAHFQKADVSLGEELGIGNLGVVRGSAKRDRHFEHLGGTLIYGEKNLCEALPKRMVGDRRANSQVLLGHSSIQTKERYLVGARTKKIVIAVTDNLGLDTTTNEQARTHTPDSVPLIWGGA